MAQAVLYAEIVPSTKGLGKKVEKEMTGGFSATEKKGKGLFSKIGGFAKVAGVAVAGAAAALVGLAVKGGFDRMLKIEDAQAKLAGLGHSTENVTAIMDNALASVKGTAFGLETAATVAASTVAAGIKPGEELTRVLKLTADAATIAGTGMDEMGAIFNKVAAKNKVSMKEINQLSQRGIPLLQWIADEYGVTSEAAFDMVSRGEIDFKTYAQLMEDNLGGAALKSGNTTRGSFANMKAALSRTGVALIEGVFPYFKTFFQGITGFLDDLNSKIGPFMGAVTERLKPVASAFSSFFSSLGDRLGPLMDQFAPLAELAGYFTPLGAVFKLLVPILPRLTDPLVQITEILVGTLAGILPIIASLFADIGSVLGGVLVMVLPVVADLLARLGSLLERIMPTVLKVADFIGDLLISAFDALMPVLDLVLGLLDPLMSIIEALIPPILAVVEAFLPLVLVLADALAPILVIVADLLVGPLGVALELIAGLITILADVIVWLVDNIVIPYIQNILIPVWSAVGAAFEWVYENVIKPMFASFGETVKNVVGFFKDVFGGLGGFFSGLWSGIEAGFKGFINFIIDGINGFISGINAVGGFLSDVTGGAINFKIGKLPRLEHGALALAVPGGTAAIIGEGRYDEAVLPLGGPQLEKIRAALQSGDRGTGIQPGDRVVFEIEGQPLTAVAKRVVSGAFPSAGAVHAALPF